MTMRAHKIKTWPTFFRAVRDGVKPFEMRRADRDYQVGDYLCLVEFDPSTDTMTGAYLYRRITFLLKPEDPPRGMLTGFVVMGLEEVDKSDQERLQGTYTGMLYRAVEWLAPQPAPVPHA